MLPRAARGASIRRAAPRPVHTVPEQTRKWHPGHRRRRTCGRRRRTTPGIRGMYGYSYCTCRKFRMPELASDAGRRARGPHPQVRSAPRPPTADERARTRADCRTARPTLRGNGSVSSCRAQNRTQVRVLPGGGGKQANEPDPSTLSGAGGTFLRLARPKRSDRRCDKIYDRQCIIAEKNDR